MKWRERVAAAVATSAAVVVVGSVLTLLCFVYAVRPKESSE